MFVSSSRPAASELMSVDDFFPSVDQLRDVSSSTAHV